MKVIFRLFRSVNSYLKYFLYASIIAVILIEFFLSKIPEKFDGGERLGSIVSRLCLSYISAFIFFFVDRHYKAYKDKKTLQPFVERKLKRILGQVLQLLGNMRNEAKVAMAGRFPTDEELTEMMQNIKPTSQGPMIIGNSHVTWLQYMDIHRQHVEIFIKQLNTRMQFLDSQLVHHLSNIEDSFFFLTISTAAQLQLKNVDLTSWQNEFGKYLKLIEELQRYGENKLGIDFIKG